MLRKIIAKWMMFAAMAIFLGHSIIPHHHHESQDELLEHHFSGAHQHDEHAGKGLIHLFSHFLHAAEGFTTTLNNSIGRSLAKVHISLVVLITEPLQLKKVSINSALLPVPETGDSYSEPFFRSSGSRAPPLYV